MRKERMIAKRGGFKCSAACCDITIQTGDSILLYGNLIYCAACAAFIEMDHGFSPVR